MGTYGQNAEQIGDVLMYHHDDCGDIYVEGGIVTMTKFYETMVYLILSGGNCDDDGSESTEKNQWWGNEGEPEEEQYRGRLQALIGSGRPVTSAFLLDAESAATEDLETGLAGYAETVTVSVVATGPKSVKFSIVILFKTRKEYQYEYEIGVAA